MSERLRNKTAIVVGGGQTPGETFGNGRATAVLFAREGARVLIVDRDGASASETFEIIEQEGGQAFVCEADITQAGDCERIVEVALKSLGRIDILHNNVGIGTGDAGVTSLDESAWHRIIDTNLTGMWLTCKHVIPVMRTQGSGAVVNISSIAAVAAAPYLVAYKVSKAGVNALTETVALANARYGIRANAIMPGLMNTPLAVDAVARARGVSREEVERDRHARVPLGQTMGSAWDVARAALFLASEESRFITGVVLPVDGGQGLLVG